MPRQILRNKSVVASVGTGIAFSSFWYGTTTASPTTDDGPKWRLRHGVFCLSKDRTWDPKVDAVNPLGCGEDSYIIAENEHQVVIGVADGVGSWRKKGVDPAKFSQGLLRHMRAIIEGAAAGGSSGGFGLFRGKDQGGEGVVEGRELIKNAFWRMIKNYHQGNEKPFGSSTVCIASVDRLGGVLESVNLGDSGLMVVREGKVLFRTEAQQHRFNAPYQLMLAPEGNVSDCSNMAAEKRIALSEGDLIMVATDGLWDNLFEKDIMEVVREGGGNVQNMSKLLVQKARAYSEREDYESPFCLEGRKSGYSRLGGKEDDITVIVAVAERV